MANGLNVDERLKAARERREQHQKLLGMSAPVVEDSAVLNLKKRLLWITRKPIYTGSLFIIASRESTRLEREQRARRYYEQQLQERKKKLLEQRLKEERRRAAVEKKRKQRLKEERVSFDGGNQNLNFLVRLMISQLWIE